MSGYKKWSLISVSLLFFVSAVLHTINFTVFEDISSVSYSSRQIVEVSASLWGITYPCEIKSYYEDENGYIILKTNPQTFVVAPISIECDYCFRDKMRGVHFKKYGFDCYFYGFENLAIKNGVNCKTGEILGSLSGDKLFVRVYKNENRVSLKTILGLF